MCDGCCHVYNHLIQFGKNLTYDGVVKTTVRPLEVSHFPHIICRKCDISKLHTDKVSGRFGSS